MLKVLTLVLVLISFGNLYSQSAKEQLELINSVTLQENDFLEIITYTNKFGYVVIPVKIGDKTYDYIFDTGGYNTLTTEIMNDQNLSSLMDVEVGSSNQIKSTISLTKINNLSIGNLNFNEVGALNFDFQEAPQIICYTNGGLIGKSLIKEAVWQINSKQNELLVTDNKDKLDYVKNAIKLKVKLDKTYNPFIKAKINGKAYTFLLDFGFDGLVSLKQKEGEKIESQNLIEVIGEGSVGANGVINESIFIKDVESFSIGNKEIPNQFISYNKSKYYNLIGAELTKHFIVTLNFKEKEVYLYPIPQNKNIESKKSFGFGLNKEGNTIYVSKIFKGQSAEKAGLQLNDTIVTINGNDFSKDPYCVYYDYLLGVMEGKKSIVLEVKRSNEIVEIRVNKTYLF